MYVTYSDMFNFALVLITLVGLCYTIFHRDDNDKHEKK